MTGNSYLSMLLSSRKRLFVEKTYPFPPHASSLELTASGPLLPQLFQAAHLSSYIPIWCFLHSGAEASLNLKLAIVVTSMCFGGGLFWVQIPALPLLRCVLYTWDNNASLSAWWWEPNETRYVECLWVCNMPTFSHTISSVSFLHFFSFVIVMHILPSWFWPGLLSPLGFAPVFVSVIRAYKTLQLGLWWNMWMVLGTVSSISCTVSFIREGAMHYSFQHHPGAWNIAGTE